MTGAVFDVMTETGSRRVTLAACQTPADQERAANEAHGWIKGLRHVLVDGQPLRRRFTYRGDSLWWFAEIYLHKEQRILDIFRTLAALERLILQERPRGLRLLGGDWISRVLAPQVAASAGIPYSGPQPSGSRMRQARVDARARWLHLAALASRVRSPRPVSRPGPPEVAAFVHRAFWRTDAGEGSAEAYIGPVLAALERRTGRERIAYVSLGPSSNFRARRWWHPLRGSFGAPASSAIESYAPLARLAPSRVFWRDRYRTRRALWNSAELRRYAVIHGCDCWAIVRHELNGIALLQWPWSVRAMDEAAASLDTLKPRAVLTYAEAGGWGRALVLESRRRGIRSIGLQHGFIFRHWLNYLHEPDEMQPDADNPGDAGFPRPAVTLLFDNYSAEHLRSRGRFPDSSLRVTGSARLDALVAEAARVEPGQIDEVRARAGCRPGDALVLLATKHREARQVLPALADAVDELGTVKLAIKPHPAETPEVYDEVARARRSVVVVPSSEPLAPLLRASRAVVTVNSTVAVDAAVLDVPALVIGLPNNLSPFVDAGLFAGAGEGTIAGTLRRILYDEEFRSQAGAARRDVLARVGIRSDGRAADRAAEAVLADD